MSESHSESYKAAGVDVTAGYEAVKRIKPMVESTYIPGVIGSIGGFGGMFAPELAGMKRPNLDTGTDGDGTKLKQAFLMNKHDTVGIDCVAMCVNDIVCGGAAPMFFLDYLAVGKLNPVQAAEIVSGIAEGCRQAECALVGGETAEMPGFYPVGDYDLAGFSVGIVDEEKIIDGRLLKPGDAIIALKSSGVHSNGYSLVRRVFQVDEKAVHVHYDALGCELGEALLTPTRIYVKAVKALMKTVDIHAISHITGGGFYENIPRMLKDGMRAVIEKNAIARPAIFDLIAKTGGIPERDMYNTFNMGAGMMIAVAKEDADRAMCALRAAGEEPMLAGEIRAGERGVEIC